MPKRLGIFGGTFDPVHHGHLILARDALEQLALDRLLFVPAAVSPHRTDRPPATTPAQRVEMLRLAIADDPRFQVEECELQRPAPSYTFDTVADIQARHPDARLHLLVGADQIARLHTWHRFEELKARVLLVIFQRANADGEIPPEGHLSLRRRLDISATEVRKRVASGLSIRYLVPGAVARFVENHQLYREANPP